MVNLFHKLIVICIYIGFILLTWYLLGIIGIIVLFVVIGGLLFISKRGKPPTDNSNLYPILLFLLSLQAFGQIDAQKYKYTVAEFESRHNYKAYNKSGACGKYQMIYRYIPKRYNCGSKKAFLLNPKAQELAMDNQIKETLVKSKKEAKKLGVHVFYLLAYYHWQGNYASLNKFKHCYKELNKRYIFFKSL